MNDTRPAPAIVRWLRAHRVLLLVLVALYALYLAFCGLWLPRLLRNAATGYVQQQLHRRLALGEVSFNPFTLTLTIRNAALSEADGTALAGFGALRVEAELWSSLFHRAYTLREIRLDDPQVNAILGADGRLNLAQLAPPQPAVPAPAATSTALPSLRVGHLQVAGGRVRVEDRTRPKPFAATLAPINFALEDFRTAAGHQNAYQFAATTTAGEKLAWSGEFTLQPVGSNGRFELDGLKATTIAGWLQDALPFELPTGSLTLAGDYRLALGGELGLTLELPQLSFSDISIAPRGAGADAAPWVRVPKLAVINTRLALGQRSVQVERVTIDGAAVVLQREADGSLNLQRLAGASGKAAPGEAQAGRPWQIGVQEVALGAASVDFTDQGVKPAVHLQLAPVQASVRGWRSDNGVPLQVSVRVGLDKGSVDSAGTVQLEPLDADLKLTLEALNLAPLQPYLAQNTSLILHSGTLGAQLQLQYHAPAALAAAGARPAARAAARLRARGDVQLANLATSDAAQNQALLNWQLLDVHGIDWQTAPDRWSIERIRLRKPYARVAIAANRSLNVRRALLAPGQKEALASDGGAAEDGKDAGEVPATGGAPATAPPAATRATPARIREILIEDGTVNFSDASLTPNFSSTIYALAGRIAGLSSDPASRAQVQLDGKVDKYAPVSIAGEVNLLAAVSYTDLTLKFSNMDLTTFNPYSGKFAGYNIERGKLTTELRYQVENRRLNAQHHVILDQLQFGAATNSKDAVPLPVKLAVALLKDSKGVIDINLPVSGSLDDPKFRIAPIVWKAVFGLLRKIVTAPFALLGSLFGGGADLQYLDFAPGSAELAPDQQDKVGKLVKALGERPQLKLDVPLQVADARDDAVLAQRAFDAALAPVLAATTAKPPHGAGDPAGLRLAALTTLYTTQSGAAPVWPENLAAPEKAKTLPSELVTARSDWQQQQLLAKYAPAPGEREALGRARAEAVRTQLVEQGRIDPERIFLAARASEGRAPDNAVRMELKLQ